MKYNVTVNEKDIEVNLIAINGTTVTFEANGECYSVKASPIFDTTQTTQAITTISAAMPSSTNKAKGRHGQVNAPMPGVIVSINATVGAKVSIGTPLLVMEAMKMENSITAPCGGTIKEIHVKTGQQVENGQLLVSIE